MFDRALERFADALPIHIPIWAILMVFYVFGLGLGPLGILANTVIYFISAFAASFFFAWVDSE